jgi:CheY-like chemotaxis protein
MQRYTILWADDEIDLLKPHILFLQQRGYDITPVNNGSEAVEQCEARHFDVVFLDEHMPGMSGLEALTLIKNNKPNLPVVMITKNEEEAIMEDAIGAKIDDYLIKPLNPSQILLSVKKILDNKRLVIKKPIRGTSRNSRRSAWHLSTTSITRGGWIFIKNWLFGNCKWTRPTTRIWPKCWKCKRWKPIPIFAGSSNATMKAG